jgi:hypothetical protein
MSLHDAITESGTVTFSAKLPDDITADEFAGLLESIAEIDRWAVLEAFRDLQVPAFYEQWRHGERSLIRRVTYGSDFEVVLQILGNIPGAAIATAGLFFTVGKTLQVLSDAGLKNEERLGKRWDRLERHEARRHAERVQERNVVYIDVLTDTGPRPALSAREEAELKEAREILEPSEARVVIETSMADENYWRSIAKPLVWLAEYGVTIRVREPDA